MVYVNENPFHYKRSYPVRSFFNTAPDHNDNLSVNMWRKPYSNTSVFMNIFKKLLHRTINQLMTHTSLKNDVNFELMKAVRPSVIHTIV